ncbi:MAG: pyruvate kinase [Parcubacteria group bacterium]|nr:pyruvate kinase [Parcubacteria group bacterium]
MRQSIKKTKIVCTIGPASEKRETLKKLIGAGMNVARLNFSHDTHEKFAEKIKNIRDLSRKSNCPVAILQDLCGPKIRIGAVKNGEIILENGRLVTLSDKAIIGDENVIPVAFRPLLRQIKKGDALLLDDGTKKLRVVKKTDGGAVCRVVVGGRLKSFKGINAPGVALSARSLTSKDLKDAKFGVKMGVDFVALSFVRSAADVALLRRFLQKNGSGAKIVAKIERPEAVSDIDGVIAAADAVMVARGDLALETPMEIIPAIQKEIIRKCNFAGKPVITATQMLESMMNQPMPTRAEITDVANAILDGTDAVMLSGETAAGRFPVETVEAMAKIAREAEKMMRLKYLPSELVTADVPQTISFSVVKAAKNLGAKAIVALTESGSTARRISAYKPAIPILALTPDSTTLRQLALSWGVHPYLAPKRVADFDEMAKIAKETTRRSNFAKKGECVVISAGIPFGVKGATNLLLVQTI